MMRSAIIIFLINYCAFLFSQNITYTKIYDTDVKLVPISIINNSPRYFYILRYNKIAHDFTLERRYKPNGNVASFTPLKLDSVNANWFDYENLDYLCFEQNNKVYFLFEKVVNNRRAIYLKTIDTNGRASGFKELAFLERNKAIYNFRFDFKLTANNKILILGAEQYVTGAIKKIALLYDPEKRENVWIKKISTDNYFYIPPAYFEVNDNDDLFFASANGDYVTIFMHNEDIMHKRMIDPYPMTDLKSVVLQPQGKVMALLSHYASDDSLFFSARGFIDGVDINLYSERVPLDKGIKEKLTFYDGPLKNAEYKNYYIINSVNENGYNYTLAGRSEENFYKEMLLRKTDLKTGVTVNQQIIPRKIFYFDGRLRYRHIGDPAPMVSNNTWYCFLLENPRNQKKDFHEFRYHKFARQEYLDGGALVGYALRPDGLLERKLLYKNETFNYVPITYSSNQSDFVFYLNNVTKEKFAILKLDEF